MASIELFIMYILSLYITKYTFCTQEIDGRSPTPSIEREKQENRRACQKRETQGIPQTYTERQPPPGGAVRDGRGDSPTHHHPQ